MRAPSPSRMDGRTRASPGKSPAGVGSTWKRRLPSQEPLPFGSGCWVLGRGAELCPAFDGSSFGPKNPGAGETSAGLVHMGRTRLEERELVGVGIALFGAGEPNQAARLRHRAARAHRGDQLGPWRRREAALSPEVGI